MTDRQRIGILEAQVKEIQKIIKIGWTPKHPSFEYDFGNYGDLQDD